MLGTRFHSDNYRNHRINGNETGAGRTFMVCDKQQERVFMWVCQKTKIKKFVPKFINTRLVSSADV